MRLRGVVLFALAAGTLACGDALTPPEGRVRDLDFVMPSVIERPTVGQVRMWDDPATTPAVIDGVETDEEALLPIIWSHSVTALFDADMLKIEYGMSGAGTGYTMSPKITVWSSSGAKLMEQDGAGRSEDAGTYLPMRPHANETFYVPSACGAKARVALTFVARVSLATISFMQRMESEEAFGWQPACPVRSGGGGSTSDAGSTAGLIICYYEVWVDSAGYVVDVFLIRCEPLGGAVLAE